MTFLLYIKYIFYLNFQNMYRVSDSSRLKSVCVSKVVSLIKKVVAMFQFQMLYDRIYFHEAYIFRLVSEDATE